MIKKVRGNYEVTLDQKGRFMMPAAVRKMVGEGTNNFVIIHGIGPYLEMYTEEQWEAVENKLTGLNDYNEDVEELLMDLMSTLQPVEMDAAGRMTLPKRMLSYAGLTKDVVLQGMLNKTLIWNQEIYQENNNSRSQERRKELRGRILGSGYTNSTPGQHEN